MASEASTLNGTVGKTSLSKDSETSTTNGVSAPPGNAVNQEIEHIIYSDVRQTDYLRQVLEAICAKPNTDRHQRPTCQTETEYCICTSKSSLLTFYLKRPAFERSAHSPVTLACATSDHLTRTSPTSSDAVPRSKKNTPTACASSADPPMTPRHAWRPDKAAMRRTSPP